MERVILENKPLIEAIFELKWELQEPAPKIKIDPHYKILVGSVYERVKDKYPFHEQLPTATMPDEIAAYVIQHRFRKNKDEWSLIQIGPGIITVNDTDGYVWEDFEERISYVIDKLFKAYPEPENLKPNGLLLRYIDAIDFDCENDYIFSFLKEKMKINIDVHQKLFEDTGVDKSPYNFDLKFSFPSTRPEGIAQLRFARGETKGVDALIWETMVQSVGEDVPQIKEDIAMWIKDAHMLTDDWFFKIIKDELLERFE